MMSAAAKTLQPVSANERVEREQLTEPPLVAPRLRSPDKHTVHWFRKGLRLHDNPALREGLLGACTFRCIFIIDPWFATSSNVGINKWRFLLQSLEDLDISLRKLNSRLFVVRGQPTDALPKLFREWGTTALTFEEDPEPYGRVRDHNIMTKCREVGITVISRVSHTLYQLDKIIELNGGKAPLTYHQFQALVASMPPPPPAEPTICKQSLHGAVTPLSDDHDDRFGVPTLEELGFETEGLKPAVWLGGENEALIRLERHLERKAWVASFGKPKMTPQSLLASQTGLSPYLRFGCLSTRLFYYQLTELYKRVKRVRPPLSLHGQLLWREFFYCAATRNPNFDRMEGNPICVQIPWEKNPDALSKWANGQTGYPWIDAIMVQLREEGWIHQLARHAVACFLTRGDLWISWEEGMKVFDELMLDADWSVNAGTWMWLSCSSFFQQFFHCYCPVRFGRKADPQGDFIRRYIPILENMPTRYVHEPWMAPLDVQQTAGCVVGVHYPMPIIDHDKASQINIERIKQVYAHLAKFKPQGSLNSQMVQRPNVNQSSPSPTLIIRNINQSSYLCSQTPPALSTTNNETAAEHSNKDERTEQNKEIPYKEVIIVAQNSHSDNTKQARFDKQRLHPDRQYHCERVSSDKCEENVVTYQKANQDNYDFKNLIIHNYEEYSNSPVNYQTPPVSQSDLYKEENSKLYYCCQNKQTFFTPTYIENGTNSQEGGNFASVRAAQLIHDNREIDFNRPNILEENMNCNYTYPTNSQTDNKGCDSDTARENDISKT